MRSTSSAKSREQQELTPDEARRRTFARAIKLLAAKPRSIAELRERLLQARSANEVAVEESINRLKEYGYLDDERYAFGYASLRVRQKPLGRRRLQRDLMLKKVDPQTAQQAIDLVFSETPEAELIDRAIAKRIRLRGHPADRVAVKSLFDHLLRQGFSFELVKEKVRQATKLDLEDRE